MTGTLHEISHNEEYVTRPLSDAETLELSNELANEDSDEELADGCEDR
jgi:hypothetical protein